MHVSIPVDQSVEVIRGTVVSPFIAKCQVKVCYVGQEPNRNKTVITKEVATEMGKKLPGSPVVGYYNEETQDFEQHTREIQIKDGKFAIINACRPYGFVPTDARVWFEKFVDDGTTEREYLVTEAYLWTQYPEVKRILEFGNNHSMELNQETLVGTWTGSENSDNRFFIINEAVIETLCILGENYEPCFEGSQIKAQFSLQDEFNELKNNLYSMMKELQEAMNEGGSNSLMENNVQNTSLIEEQIPPVEGQPANDYSKEEDEKKKQETDSGKENQTENQENKETKDEKKENKEEDDKGNSNEDDKKKDEKDKKAKYNLDDIPEYVELQAKYSALETENYSLKESVSALENEIAPLREFKAGAEMAEKQAMIDSFYMLSDEDKKDVKDNINSYSLEDIEAKLSVICVRNRVNFNLDDNNSATSAITSFNFNEASEGSDADVPAWIKAVQQTASSMN